MKKNLSRLLAVALAVALVVTCAISGLILPVAAEDEATNGDLLANVAAAKQTYVMQYGSADQAIETGVSLTSGTRYVLYVIAKSSATTNGTGLIKQNVNSTALKIYNSTNWMATAVYFKPTKAIDNFTITISFPTTVENDTMEVKDFVLKEAPMDGSFNVVPGGTFDTESIFLVGHHSAGATVAPNPDDQSDSVLYFPAGSTNYSNRIFPDRLAGNASYLNSNWHLGKFVKITFQYKGTITFKNSTTGSILSVSGSFTASTSVDSLGRPTTYTFSSPDAWETAEIYLDRGTDLRYFYFSTDKNAAYMDDLCVYEVVKATEIAIQEPVQDIYAGMSTQLKAEVLAPFGVNAYIGTLAWSSSDEETISVDAQTGIITALKSGTATITVTNEELSATRDIVVKAPTVNETLYFEDNTIYVDAVAGSKTDLFAKLKTVDGYTVQAEELTWSLANTKTNYWGVNKNYTGEAFDVVWMEGVQFCISPLDGDREMYMWSLASVKPTVTVVDANGNMAVANVEWVYADTLLNVDFDTVGTGYAPIDTTVVEEDGNAYAVLDSATYGSTALPLNLVFKPNSIYRISLRAKNSTEDTKNIGLTWYFFTLGDAYMSGAARLNTERGTGKNKWITYEGYMHTGENPATIKNFGMYLSPISQNSDTGTIAIDDLLIQRVDVDSDFENGNAWFDYPIKCGKGEYTDEEVGQNTDTKVKIYSGSSDVKLTDYRNLKARKVYRLSFKKYGGQVTFNNSGADGQWDGNIIEARDNVRTFAAADEWVDCSFTFATGQGIINSGNWTSALALTASGGDVYIRDCTLTEVQAAYVCNVGGRNGKVKLLDKDGAEVSILTDVKANDVIQVLVQPDAGYLPKGAVMQYLDEAGQLHSFFNTALQDMTNSNGTVFKFKMPEGCAGVFIEKFVSAADTNYQWATQASAVYRENGKVTRLRFLNRLYINGFVLTEAESISIKINGTTYTVTEIGAIARVADSSNPLTVDMIGTKGIYNGICYSDQSTSVRVTDYTKRYFDFTVYIPITEANMSTNYDCIAYMKLADENGNEVDTIYTNMWTDSAQAAVNRGA